MNTALEHNELSALIQGVTTSRRSSAPKSDRRKEKRFKGLPASPGIVIGRAITHTTEPLTIRTNSIAAQDVALEQERFRTAVHECTSELQRIIVMAQEEAPVAAPILEAQLFIMNDPTVGEMIQQRIEQLITAEYAVQQVFDEHHRILQHAPDTYLRERAMDLDNVKNRLLDYLCNRTGTRDVEAGCIVLGSVLTPSDVMLFKKSGMVAFVTELSGIASHTAILARSLHLPSVIGVPNVASRINSGVPVIIDGYAGIVIIHPKPETVAKYERRRIDFEKREKKLGRLTKLNSQTSDGRKIHLFANADTLDEIEEARSSGAEGVGLVRTELQLIELKRLPTEEEQVEWYTELAERAYPLPLTVRAFDIGSDKSFGMLPPEPNPALGLRGLRFLLKNRGAFMGQIRAILRASQHRNVRLMLPMVTSVQEFQKGLAIVEQAKKSLRDDEMLFDDNLPVGAMIETPSAALMARELGALADFFSIGTNDLIQYTLAADRLNASIINVYDSFHPAVLRLIKMTVEAAQFNNIPVAVCGEFAGHSAATELLIGLGIEELSVVPSVILELKKRIRKTSYTDAVTLTTEALQLNTGIEIRKYVASAFKKSSKSPNKAE